MMDTTIIYNDYLSGDAKALERLMEIYGDKLTLYINGYIKNLHDSEDLLIEVFAYLSRWRHARHPEEFFLSGRGDHAMSVPCTDEASPRYRRDGSGKCVAEM